MKVILLAPLPPPHGGIAAWTVRMLNAKLKNNWRIGVVDEKVIGNREAFGNNAKRNVFMELTRTLKIWKNLQLELQDNEVKIVHSCIPSATLSMAREYICAVITKLNRRKFIIHFRSTIPNISESTLSNFLLKKICNISDEIIVLNQQSYSYIEKKTKKTISVIPNFIEVNEVKENKKINENIKKMLYVGGVVPEKGCLEIIEIAKEFPNIEFKMIGKIDSRVSLQAKNIKNIVLTGPKNRTEIQYELDEADVFLFLSHYKGEGFSNALTEAMAAGLPCIVTDWAANADMIENKGGFVVPIKEPKEAVRAVKKIQSAKTRKEQSDFNVKKVMETYSDSIVLSKYVEVYDRLEII